MRRTPVSLVASAVLLGAAPATAVAQSQPTTAQFKPSQPPEKSEPMVNGATTPATPLRRAREPDFPKVLPKAVAQPLPVTWSAEEAAAGRARCTALLKDLAVVVVPATPIREGVDCGAAAPVELISIGKSPQVTFSPTVVMTCDMVAALHTWITKDLQPLARRHMGSELIRIDTMSSYSCRMAYGRAHGRLSEHGKANALDIRAFMFGKGDTADVLANWGPTARDIQAQVATAQAAARKAEAERAAKAAADAATIAAGKAAPARPGQPSDTGIAVTQPSQGGVTGPTLSHRGSDEPVQPTGIPRVNVQIPGLGNGIGITGTIGVPNRLGGPKPKDGEVAVPVVRGSADGGGGRMTFLREAHRSACRIFGTVLGPEANNAHRNHFHVDMAQRRSASFCE